jgi:uncharacterized membrane-anchored protein YitT (DUF2179 family)
MRPALLIVTGIVMGSIAILYHHHAVAEAGLKGYELGAKRALSVSPPSERLENVCAALWFSDIGEEWKKRGLDDEPPTKEMKRF